MDKSPPVSYTHLDVYKRQAINISEEAFKNMKDDPEYREKILSALKRDLTSSFAQLEASMVLTVGATAKDYRGDSWSGVNNLSLIHI